MNRDADRSLDSGWEDCPPGEVGRLVSRLRARRRRETAQQAALGVAAVCLLVFAGNRIVSQLPNGGRQRNFHGLTCFEVYPQLEAYVAGTLDAETVRLIDAHLVDCRPCRKAYEELRDRAAGLPVDRHEAALWPEPVLISQALMNGWCSQRAPNTTSKFSPFPGKAWRSFGVSFWPQSLSGELLLSGDSHNP